MNAPATRLVAVEYPDEGLAVYRVDGNVASRADAEASGTLVAVRRPNRVRPWKRFAADADGRSLRHVERIGGGTRAPNPALVELTLSADDWRKKLCHSDRRRILDLVTPRFPETGSRATVVIGPLERDSIGAHLCWHLAGRAGASMRERILKRVRRTS